MITAAPGPLEAYRARVARSDIAFDEAQAAVAESLELLRQRIIRWHQPGRAAKLLTFSKAPERPRGLYIFGGVGRGKSMLMDMFFASAPLARKRRVHFHEFMAEMHGEIGRWRKSSPADRKRAANFVRGAGDDPIPPAAEHVAQDAELLCFDEFHVEDPATAMILGRLFEQLFARGVVIVATSNCSPDDLYRDGINRQLFVPFIALLKHELDILELDSGTDYRLSRILLAPTYHVAEGAAAAALLDTAWADLTDGSKGALHSLSAHGRTLQILTAKGVARASFDYLCREARGAEDYLMIAKAFPVLIVDSVPKLGAEERNEALRFVHLIDALYEQRVKLVCSAAVPPAEIAPFVPAFERAASRLIEMQSKDYFSERHRAA